MCKGVSFPKLIEDICIFSFASLWFCLWILNNDNLCDAEKMGSLGAFFIFFHAHCGIFCFGGYINLTYMTCPWVHCLQLHTWARISDAHNRIGFQQFQILIHFLTYFLTVSKLFSLLFLSGIITYLLCLRVDILSISQK